MTFEQQFGEVRSCLQRTPSRYAFATLQHKLGSLFRAFRSRSLEQVMPYVREHVESWPAKTRFLELSVDTDPRIVPRDLHQLELVRELRFGPHGIFDRKQRKLASRFVQVMEQEDVGTWEFDHLELYGNSGVWDALTRAPHIARVTTLLPHGGLTRDQAESLVTARWSKTVETIATRYQTVSPEVAELLTRELPALRAPLPWALLSGPFVGYVPELGGLWLREGPGLERLRALPGVEALAVYAEASMLDVLGALGEERARRLRRLSYSPVHGLDALSHGVEVSRQRCAWLSGLEWLGWHGGVDALGGDIGPEALASQGLRVLELSALCESSVMSMLDVVAPGGLDSLRLHAQEPPERLWSHPALRNLEHLELHIQSRGEVDWERVDRALPHLRRVELSIPAHDTSEHQRSLLASSWLDRLDVLMMSGFRWGEAEAGRCLARAQASGMCRLALTQRPRVTEAPCLIPYVRCHNDIPF